MTIASAPLTEQDKRFLKLIWVNRETEYFSQEGWTGKTDLPVGLGQNSDFGATEVLRRLPVIGEAIW